MAKKSNHVDFDSGSLLYSTKDTITIFPRLRQSVGTRSYYFPLQNVTRCRDFQEVPDSHDGLSDTSFC